MMSQIEYLIPTNLYYNTSFTLNMMKNITLLTHFNTILLISQ